ncbi:MAG: hypothetical protein K2X68_03190, partial [Novosphingobium sp.]|nr:hypothetical protein [Novosphingobium sp.]
MKTAYTRVTRSILMATAAFAAPVALAQTAPQDSPQAAGETTAVADGTEIIVTAQKRSENLQSVPFSIQAFGTKKLDELNISSFDD